MNPDMRRLEGEYDGKIFCSNVQYTKRMRKIEHQKVEGKNETNLN